MPLQKYKKVTKRKQKLYIIYSISSLQAIIGQKLKEKQQPKTKK